MRTEERTRLFGELEESEIEDLLAALREGDGEVARYLIELLLDWVVQVAREISFNFGRRFEAEELYGSGVEGLVEALKRFDVSRGTGLQSYCKARIRGAILDEIRRGDAVPRSERQRVRRMQEAREKLSQHYVRPPAEYELAHSLGLRFDNPRLACGERISRGVRSFSELLPGDATGSSLEDALMDERACGARTHEDAEGFHMLIREFSAKERSILMLYYADDLSMREVGEMLGLCESRVSQIHKNLLRRLRIKFAEQESEKR